MYSTHPSLIDVIYNLDFHSRAERPSPSGIQDIRQHGQHAEWHSSTSPYSWFIPRLNYQYAGPWAISYRFCTLHLSTIIINNNISQQIVQKQNQLIPISFTSTRHRVGTAQRMDSEPHRFRRNRMKGHLGDV